jgi:hypothetical protein
MTATALRAALAARGITLTLDSGRLRVTAPRGAIQDDDRAALREHRHALAADMREQAIAWREAAMRA